MNQKYLDLAGLTAYDAKIKAWFKSSVVDITDYMINALFIEGPTNNEIWYTSKDGNIVTPNNIHAFGANIVSNTYENGKGVIILDGEVTTFNSYAFTKKCKLDTIVIPTSVTSIESYAFWDCPVNTVVLHDKLKSLGSKCFYNCQGLKSITLPKSITNITNAFMNCKNLQQIIFEGTMEEWNAVYKRDGWNSIVPATYVQCTDGQVQL